MELGIILPSYRNLLRVNNKEVTEKTVQMEKSQKSIEKTKPKNANTSISNQNNGRVVDVSI